MDYQCDLMTHDKTTGWGTTEKLWDWDSNLSVSFFLSNKTDQIGRLEKIISFI